MTSRGRPHAAEWDQIWLPLWPYATDHLATGIYRMSRPDAMERRYVEANPQAVSNLLVVDIDHADAALRALCATGSHPMPNAIVENPANGHAHAVWALAEPVTRTEYAHRKPLAYAAAVTEGLRRALDGDQGYSGLLTKNPQHASWHTQWISGTPRTLDQLATGLGDRMPPKDWRRTKGYRDNIAGLGRNCALFESARTWAYREARKIRLRHEHATLQDSADLLDAITTEVHQRNTAFPEPLPTTEAHAIATSIHRWTTTRFHGWTDSRIVNQATFTAIQSARGKNGGRASGAVRRARSAIHQETGQ